LERWASFHRVSFILSMTLSQRAAAIPLCLVGVKMPRKDDLAAWMGLHPLFSVSSEGGASVTSLTGTLLEFQIKQGVTRVIAPSHN